jgi:hypothetical protein
MALWGLNPEVLGSLWLMASATWGKSLQLKASMIGEGGPCPFFLCHQGAHPFFYHRLGVKREEPKSVHSPPCSTEMMNVWSFFTPTVKDSDEILARGLSIVPRPGSTVTLSNRPAGRKMI